jgi:hypothetical protein
MARKKMKDDVNYERYSNVLGNLTDVYKIEIKNIANNTLQFDVHANTQAILKKHPVLFILKLDSDGEIILL